MKQRKTIFFILPLLIISTFNIVISQNSIASTLTWHENLEKSDNNLSFTISESLSDADYAGNNPLPFIIRKVDIPTFGEVKFSLEHIHSEPLKIQGQIPDELKIGPSPQLISSIIQERNNYSAFCSFVPIIRTSTGYEKITEFRISYTIEPKFKFSYRGPEFKSSSLLQGGDIYKIAVGETGIYKISYADLQSFGIDPSSINPQKIQILGNPEGPNPEAIAADRIDDLIENSIYIEGEDDNSFDQGDFILFYAQGPNDWEYRTEGHFDYEHNIYSYKNFYFLKIANEDGARVENRNSISGEYSISNNFDAYKRYEKDGFNLLADFESAQGSGQIWFSDKFSAQRELDYSSFFSDPLIKSGEDARFEFQFAARSSKSSKAFLSVEGSREQLIFNGVSVANIESRYADLEKKIFTKNLTTTNPEIILEFPNTSNNVTGWLDYIQMNYTANLTFGIHPLFFRKIASKDHEFYGFEISTSQTNPIIWDISNAESIKSQNYSTISNGVNFIFKTDGINEFVVFSPSQINRKVEFIESIQNQNLHGIQDAEVLILYHKEFESAAEKLASHRADYSLYNTIAVSVDKVYNEFSSGKAEPTAIRNFARMLYTRDSDFKFLVLLGDGSFDYKHIRKNEYSNENFIPVFETHESFGPIESFPTDDFYALLDEQEGGNLKGGLDIAVGRLPARTSQEADNLVEKIISYETKEERLEDWRLRIAFAGDDEDGNIHMRDADFIAERVSNKFRNFNQEKIFFDAYPQISTPGGERYPQATEAINNNIFKGLLTLCYLGHGGPKGWAQERVLKLDDIENWDNENKLPLVVTATCSFTGFDDPKITSAGESVLLKEKKGAIGLFTTVRAVYANQNKRLTQAVFDTIFTKSDGAYLPIGEVLRRAKNSNQADTLTVNARKFLLVGDPAMKLALPTNNIITNKINGKDIDETYVADTIKALQKMEIEGFITNPDGSVKSDFNGTITCSVFDKMVESKTLGNNISSPPRSFNVQKTILFKGQAKVEAGKFNLEFFLPSDINFEYGNGKLSYYAKSDNDVDAWGSFEEFIIGGSDSGTQDDNPPLVDVFLNTEDFAFGGISTSNPILLVKLQDDFGINVSGVSIGHDLIAELDGDSKQRYILNEFYKSELNNFKVGKVEFPLKDLSPGKHTIKVKAWDLSNNLGEGYTEFIVSDNLEESLQHVFNYPNPFSTRTRFQFEHNLPGMELEIIIHIYNMSGQIVKTIEHLTIDDGFRIDDIEWDGKGDYGGKIANGVYLYKINVTASQLGISKESNLEKLVIIN